MNTKPAIVYIMIYNNIALITPVFLTSYKRDPETVQGIINSLRRICKDYPSQKEKAKLMMVPSNVASHVTINNLPSTSNQDILQALI